ncbi:hypothetical protein KQY27_05295 [Methanobrevibacter sp. TMH8]|uniref:effector binding domain-containing protein n=1 Tax=Methanobrevibacter sp. TMH8 TaxID=2848611 RepID=UPI001CCAD967|nr:effector binding domain-containing protein [Methanobrevibacter sp. TMH8]MBZ9570956.1 hypothetical protein [Methanobrevibacter sp. TMH8]
MKLHKVKSTRANNFSDDIAKIIDLWQESIMSNENYTGNWYGVYHEYESDFKGDYTLSICNEDISSNKDNIIIDDKQKYETFEVKSRDDLPKVWQKIWDLELKGQLKRAYTIDYEKYSKNNITIHIALK